MAKKNGKEISFNIFVTVDEKGVLKSLKSDFVMANFKRFYSAVKAAKKIMADWSDEEDDDIDMVILPTENVYVITDDE